MQADKSKIINLLKTAKGQIDGLIKMVEENKYCIDISNQLLAAQAVLKTANREVLQAHLNSCVLDALSCPDAEQKIQEINILIDKLTR